MLTFYKDFRPNSCVLSSLHYGKLIVMLLQLVVSEVSLMFSYEILAGEDM